MTSNPTGTSATGVRRSLRLIAAAIALLASVRLGWSAETSVAAADGAAHVAGVIAIGMTVRDAARSTAFFHDVLGFEKIADFDLEGPAYDRLWALTGARAHVVRLRLGAELLELTEFVTPKGRPYPAG